MEQKNKEEREEKEKPSHLREPGPGEEEGGTHTCHLCARVHTWRLAAHLHLRSQVCQKNVWNDRSLH